MKIKINDQNNALIQIALNEANGNATAHTFRWANEIIDCARQAEAWLQHLALKKGSRSGAIGTATSGGSVANAYKYARITSTATLVRGSTAWFLTSLTASETYRRTAGDTFVSLLAITAPDQARADRAIALAESIGSGCTAKQVAAAKRTAGKLARA
jgi:hypothetical protein